MIFKFSTQNHILNIGRLVSTFVKLNM
uniref:Uncharacterized protein n=1 Tax=Romanomermis culicivorax TaxID=13658 RepID=A0A915HMK7_ROMCU